MNLLKRVVMGVGGVAVLTFVLQLAAPRAVHAVAAALVQVTNTASNPAITQDVSKLQSQTINLYCATVCVQWSPDSGQTGGSYIVPAGHTLMITTVEIDAVKTGVFLLSRTTPTSTFLGPSDYVILEAGTHTYPYSSPLIFEAGTSNISIQYNFTNDNEGQAVLTGYLTTN